MLFQQALTYKTIILPEIDSTNNEAKRLIMNGIDGDVLIIAKKQTAGKGRLGRSFYSPENTGLYMSYVFCVDNKLSENAVVTCVAAVATAKAIADLTNLEPKIKWVNDLFLNGKKVSGILCESVTDKLGKTYVIVGIGVNISTNDFPEDLQQTAASLNKKTEAKALANRIVYYLKSFLELENRARVMNEYRRLSFVLNKKVAYVKNSVMHQGIAKNIDDDGRLTVVDDDGNEDIIFYGEISLKLDKECQ